VPIPDEAATLAARFEHRDVGGKRVVAGRVGEWLGHDRRGADIVGGEIGAAQALLAEIAAASVGRYDAPEERRAKKEAAQMAQARTPLMPSSALMVSVSATAPNLEAE